MKNINDDIAEIKEKITQLDCLIAIGETFIREFNQLTASMTMDEIPKDTQDAYVGVLSEIKNARACRDKLEGFLSLMYITNKIATYNNEAAEHDRKENNNE